jgi:acetylornithine deacetylase
MNKLGIRPRGDLINHIVIEEETGGNGTLAMIRQGEEADVAINLEATGMDVYTSIRGALWFECTFYGRAGHSGSAGTTVSALKMAVAAMDIIESYNNELLEKTHGEDPLFLKYPNPMPITFGILNAGDWPAMAPPKAELKGVFGILTTSKEEVMAEIERRLREDGPEWLRDEKNFDLKFTYRHDTSRMDPSHPAVQMLLDSYHEMGVDSEIGAAPYGADAWFYNNILDIPTICTGCGSITDAHTQHENIVLEEMAVEAAAILNFIEKFSGVESK